MATYRDPIIAALIELLNASGPLLLKNRYFSGDPVRVAKSNLPAVFITKDETRIGSASNAEDRQIMPLVVNVVLDLTRDFGQAFDRANSADMLYEAVEARGSDFKLVSTSLAYQLRKHHHLASELWISVNDDLQIDYGVGLEKRGTDVYTVEAILRFTVTFDQIRPGMEA